MIAEPAEEFFFYAFLMFIVMGVFIAIATQYHYVNEHDLMEDTPCGGEDVGKNSNAVAERGNVTQRTSIKRLPKTVSASEEKDSKC